MSDQWVPARSSVAAWATYDLANTIFAFGVGGVFFPEWLVDIQEQPDLALALAIDAAMVAVIVLAPLLGARSDHFGHRRPYLIGATLIAVSATFFLTTPGIGASVFLFSLSLAAFHLGSLFYDSLLADVSTPATRGRVSGIGVGTGYIGSFIAVAVGLAFLDERGYAFVFRLIAVLFLLFALPAFFFIRERPRARKPGRPPGPSDAFRQVVASWKDTSSYRGLRRFLLGRFLYADAINTLIGGFLVIFAKEEVGFTEDEFLTVAAVGIIGSIIGGFAGGRLADRLGPRRVLHGVIYTWIAAWTMGLVAAALDAKALGTLLVVVGGLALGGTWASDRAYMARITPPARFAEFYGLYATVGRFATIFGPLLWGFIVTVLGLSRSVALMVLLGFLVAARVVLDGVDDEERDWQPKDMTELGYAAE